MGRWFMRLGLLLLSISLLSKDAIAQTGNDPKVVLVNVANKNGSLPDGATLTFQGYVIGREGEQITSHTGAGIGGFQFDLAVLPTQWIAGDTLVVDVQNPGNAQTGSGSTVLGAGSASLNVQLGSLDVMAPANDEILRDTRTPRFTWNAVPAATWYQVYLGRKNGNTYQQYYKTWLEQTDASWTIGAAMPCGQYEWWVRPWDATNGNGVWEGPARFEIECCLPGAPTLVSPSGCAANCGVVAYTWNAMDCATWYQLQVNDSQGKFFRKWFDTGAQAGPIARSVAGHKYGAYTWWVRAWGPDGTGPWSEQGEVGIGMVEPTALTSAQVCWDDTCESGATWVQVYINRGNTTVNKDWVDLSLVEGNCYDLPDALSSGNYTVWMRAWRDSCGFGPWSAAAVFAVP